jgi:hypothetical protein
MLSLHAPIHPPASTTTSRAADTGPTVLITEQEVKLLTAAAGAATAPGKPRLLSRWIAAARASRATRHHRWHYAPQHYDFLEHSAMARAMERL